MTKRSEAPRILTEFIVFIENQATTGDSVHKVKRISTDLAGELSKDQELKKFVTDKGINLAPADPGEKNQNAKAERSIGVILERGRVARIAANLPEPYWTASSIWSCTITNDLPKKSLQWISSNEKLFQLKPDLHRHHAFGSLCYTKPLATEIDKVRGNIPCVFLYRTTNGCYVELLDLALNLTGKRSSRRDTFGFTESAVPFGKGIGGVPVIPPEQPLAVNIPSMPPRTTSTRMNTAPKSTPNFSIPTTTAASPPTAPMALPVAPLASAPPVQQQPFVKPSAPTYVPPVPPVAQAPTVSKPIVPTTVSMPTPASAPAVTIAPAYTAPATNAPAQTVASTVPANHEEKSAKRSTPTVAPTAASQREPRSTAGSKAHWNKDANDAFEWKVPSKSQKSTNFVDMYTAPDNDDNDDDDYAILFPAANHLANNDSDSVLDDEDPVLLQAFATVNDDAPSTFEEAAKSPEWLAAAQKELTALHQRNTFMPVKIEDVPANTKPISTKWLFKRKSDGSAKARLVARGFAQLEGRDFDPLKISAPVAQIAVFRLLLAIAAAFGLTVISSDYVSAFTNALLPDAIYIHAPPGLIEILYPELPTGRYYVRLLRALYGLRQSAYLWNETLAQSFVANGFNRAPIEPCLFSKHQDDGIVLSSTHVDDTLTVCSPHLVESTKSTLTDMFDCSDPQINPPKFLHWNIDYSDAGIHISSSSFIDRAVRSILSSSLYPVYSPPSARAAFNADTAADVDPATLQRYQSMVGIATYAVYSTRPDVAFIASEYASVTKPSDKHVNAMEHTLRYLLHTRQLGILYPRGINSATGTTSSGLSLLSAASDSDHAGCPVTRRSHNAGIVYFNDAPIDWLSRKQRGVPSISASDAELSAIVATIDRTEYYRNLLDTLQISVNKWILRTDSLVISTVLNGPAAAKARHSAIRVAFAKHFVDSGILELLFVRSKDQPCDCLTKPMERLAFQQARNVIPMTMPPNQTKTNSSDP